MKKLLLYLLLIACFESFISSTTCYCWNHKTLSNVKDRTVSVKDQMLLQHNLDIEIHPVDIFSIRYF